MTLVRPGRRLYKLVTRGLRRQGTNLHAWCLANAHGYSSAYKALMGERNGVQAKGLRRLLVDVSRGEDMWTLVD